MAKRIYGTGSVYPLKNGKWAAQIRLENGRFKRVSCRSYEEADRKALEMSVQYRDSQTTVHHIRPSLSDASFAVQFWNRMKAVGDCWEWQGARTSQGYGRVSGKGCSISATRVAYTLAYGPIADHFIVCHRCDNPPCCNPAHLFIGTHKDNMRDAAKKGRLGRKTSKTTSQS